MQDGKPVYMEYASPVDTPHLMERWLVDFNKKLDAARTQELAIETYAWAHLSFVRIHPLFDGNGRMARLLANLPVLRGGYPPIVIDVAGRATYIGLLWEYQSSMGTIKRNSEFVPPHGAVDQFKQLLAANWNEILDLVEAARQRQKQRETQRPETTS
jgi:Fic family protein